MSATYMPYVYDGELVVNGGAFSVQQKFSETQPDAVCPELL